MTPIKNIVITGASKGLGKELAKKLSQGNHNLILVARNKDGLETVQKEIHAQTGKLPLIITCDVSREGDVKNMTGIIKEHYRHIDVLVNNAGIGIPKILEDMTSEEMRRHFEINFFGVIYCIKELLPLLKVSTSGYIINIGSLLSKVSYAQTSIYSSTKFALNGFTEGFRYEIKSTNIKVGFFMPGPMSTSFHDDLEENTFKAPALLTINPKRAAVVIEKMICNRKKNIYMYRWILWLMKIKHFAATLG